MSNPTQATDDKLERLQEIKNRQAMLRASNYDHHWRSILAGAGLNYNSTMVQFQTKYISDEKMSAIEQELSKREIREFD